MVERQKIRTPIRWARDPTLPAGVNFRVTRHRNRESVIRIRNLPLTVDDVPKIAHELTHVLQDEEGYPIVDGAGPMSNLASALGSMLRDAILHEVLGNYGFDLGRDVERELEETLRQLENRHVPPPDHLSRVGWIINYAGSVLEWESYGANECVERLKRFFRGRFPEISSEGDRLIELMTEVGFTTPEKMYKALRLVITRYELKGKVELVERVPGT